MDRRPVGRLLATIVGLLAGALLVLGVDQAAADVYLDPPTPAQLVDSGGKDGGAMTPQWTYENGTFACSVPWATAANKPSGYAIGNCRQGVRMDRYYKSDQVPDTGRYYDGGKIAGGINGCGWLWTAESSLVSDSNTTECASLFTRPESDFMAFSNNCSGSSSCDGTLITNPRECRSYANFRPWSTSSAANEYLRTIAAGSTRLRWRYVTRYSNTNSGTASGQYAMVRDTAVSPGQGNWTFVPRSCLGI